MGILELIVLVIVLGVAWWAVTSLLGAFNVPDPIKTVIIVLFVVAALVIVVNSFGVVVPYLHIGGR